MPHSIRSHTAVDRLINISDSQSHSYIRTYVYIYRLHLVSGQKHKLPLYYNLYKYVNQHLQLRNSDNEPTSQAWPPRARCHPHGNPLGREDGPRR